MPELREHATRRPGHEEPEHEEHATAEQIAHAEQELAEQMQAEHAEHTEHPQPAHDPRYANFRVEKGKDGRLHILVETPKGVMQIPLDERGGAILSKEDHEAFMRHLASEEAQSGHKKTAFEKEKAYREDILERQEKALEHLGAEIEELKKPKPLTGAQIWKNIIGHLSGVVAFHWLTTFLDFLYSPGALLRDRFTFIRRKHFEQVLRKETKVLEKSKQKHLEWLQNNHNGKNTLGH